MLITYPISESSLHILSQVQAALNVIEAYSSFIGLVSHFVHSDGLKMGKA